MRHIFLLKVRNDPDLVQGKGEKLSEMRILLYSCTITHQFPPCLAFKVCLVPSVCHAEFFEV